MNSFRTFVRDCIPPLVGRMLHRPQGGGIRFEGEFSTWEEASVQCTGYDADNILSKVLDATLKVKRGEAAFERDSVLFDKTEYDWPVLACLMWIAAHHGGRLNVLDFGGALGSCYFQNRKFLQTLPEVCWNVVEQAHYVDAGKTHVQNEQLHFYKTIQECLRENTPNIILLSSVLQYLVDPCKTIEDLIVVNADAIIIDKTIVNTTDEDKFYVQHVPSTIYSATYPCRSLSENVLLKQFADNYQIVEDFPSLQFTALHSIAAEFKGYIFRRNA